MRSRNGVVSTAVASQVLVRPLATYGMEADALWQNSVACALAAEMLAEQIQVERNVAYTIGLLHSIGMVAIDDWAVRRQPGLRLLSKGLPLESCEAERATLGFHQAEAGATLLRLWAFPPVMSEPVRWQYLPTGTAAHFQLAALLHAAKWIRTAVLHPHIQPATPNPALLAKLGVTPKHLEHHVENVAARLRRINQQLDVETTSISLHFPAGERRVSQSKFRQAG